MKILPLLILSGALFACGPLHSARADDLPVSGSITVNPGSGAAQIILAGPAHGAGNSGVHRVQPGAKWHLLTAWSCPAG